MTAKGFEGGAILSREGSGASGDFGPAKARSRAEDRQTAKHICFNSSRFQSLTRSTREASAAHLLSPHVDHLFDEGFISFSDDGDLLVADALHRGVLATWGIPLSINVGQFRSEQAQYLDYHRRHVFRGCED
jgi:hypothetical protein